MSEEKKVWSLTPDEEQMLEKYRHTKKMGHAEGVWCIRHGQLVKLHVTEKVEVQANKLREGDEQ